jgi:hypothetical protein
MPDRRLLPMNICSVSEGFSIHTQELAFDSQHLRTTEMVAKDTNHLTPLKALGRV